MKALAFAPRYNSTKQLSDGRTATRVDATGAFQPEAKRWLQWAGDGKLVLFDNNRPYPSRRKEIADALIALPGKIDSIGFFCHGWRSGLQVGYLNQQVEQFAGKLNRALVPNGRVILYACDAARDWDADRKDDIAPGPGGDGGFAALLWDAMAAIGFAGELFAHATEGHTSRNPYVRRWSPNGRGLWVVEPKSKQWNGWVARMNAANDPTRWELRG